MKKKNVTDNRRITFESAMKKDSIGFLEGRPRREKVIGPDDLMNIKIALHSSHSLEDFLKSV